MAVITDKKTTSGYNVDIQYELLKKYKSANGWFWSAFKRYPLMYLFGIIVFGASTYLATKTTALIGEALDYLLVEGFSTNFNKTIGLMIIYVIISWACLSSGAYVWSIASFRVQRDMRQEFYEVIQDHSMAFFDVNDSGVILSMGMNEINQIRMAIHPSIRMLMTSIFSIVITTVFLWQYDFIIGVTVAVSFVVYLIIAWIYASKVGPIRRKLAKDLADLSATSQEMFRGIDVVRSFDNHNKEINKFGYISNEYALDMKKEGYLSAFYWPALITIVFTAASFGYGIWLVIEGSFSIGIFISVLALLMALSRQNFMIPMRLIMLQAGLQNSKRLWDSMAFKDPLTQPEKPVESEWNKKISFNNISFAYPSTDKKVLDNLSFQIQAGARVALIGGPGSGKSTILKLLLRLYDPTEGDILINGVSMSSMHTSHVRFNVTMVEQDIFLFSDTLKANISFAKRDATDEEISKAAERAQISQFIESLPNQYDTVIGERGVTLSGGQRQRVAIARALLSNPKLLLLDDSTSAVDIKTELRLRKAMDELMKDRTSIVVTQRLTTLVAADMIILMKKGRIVDIGSHTELLERCQDYQFMCQHLPITNGSVASNDVGGRN